MVISGERKAGRDKWGRELRDTTIMCKISYKDILYNTEYSQYFTITINGV